MRYSKHGWFREQFGVLRRQFLQEGELPFTSVLSEETISPALQEIDACWKDRIFSPLVTLWVFLGQVLSIDHSCRGAVARLVTHRVSQGRPPCSAKTGAYCQARKRLPERFFATITAMVGRALDSQVEKKWLWKDRCVYMFDGTTVNMPDTVENQEDADPQSASYRQTETGRSIRIRRGKPCESAAGMSLQRRAGFTHQLT